MENYKLLQQWKKEVNEKTAVNRVIHKRIGLLGKGAAALIGIYSLGGCVVGCSNFFDNPHFDNELRQYNWKMESLRKASNGLEFLPDRLEYIDSNGFAEDIETIHKIRAKVDSKYAELREFPQAEKSRTYISENVNKPIGRGLKLLLGLPLVALAAFGGRRLNAAAERRKVGYSPSLIEEDTGRAGDKEFNRIPLAFEKWKAENGRQE